MTLKINFTLKKVTSRLLHWKIKGIMTYKLIDPIVGEDKININISARLNFVSQVYQKKRFQGRNNSKF